MYTRINPVCRAIIAAALALGLCSVTATARAQGGAIRSGDTVTGTISPRSPTEVWTFEAMAGDVVEITMESLGGDLVPSLRLLDPADQIVAEHDGEPDDAHARLLVQLESDGSYAILATASDASTSGSYSLTLRHFTLPPRSDLDGARTYYDTLDLSTPEAAVRTFADAFQRQDFITVYMVLSANARFVMQQTVNVLRFNRLVQGEKWPEVANDIPVMRYGLGHTEHSDADMYDLFDAMMLSALKHDGLLIDLSGEVTILSSRISQNDIPGPDFTLVIDVTTTVEGIEGQVIFRMVQSASGRWRVHQVVVPGGDLELWPWAVPPEMITPVEPYNRPRD